MLIVPSIDFLIVCASLCHCEHYLTHLTVHKAIELAELSRNDKKDHVSQMSLSESSAPAEPWPTVCVCKCARYLVRTVWYVHSYRLGQAVRVFLQRRLVTVTALKSQGTWP